MAQDYFGGFNLANHKSAAKRARQSLRKTAINTARKRSVRTEEKKLRDALSAKDKKSAETLLSAFMSKIDRAAKNGLIKSQTAARKIGRLSQQVNGLK